MSKLGGWRKSNWYYDEAFHIPRCGGPWDKRKIMALLRRNWKAQWRVENARRIAWHNKRRLPTKSPVPSEIKLLARDRWAMKMQGDYASADRLRDKLESFGFVLIDTMSGPLIRWRNNPSTQAVGGDHR